MAQDIEDSGLRCLECDYNLTGLKAQRCPECGWVVDNELLNQLHAETHSDAMRGLTALLSTFVGLLILLVLALNVPPILGTIFGKSTGLKTIHKAIVLSPVAMCGLLHLVIAWICMTQRRTWPAVSPIVAWLCRIVGIIEMAVALAFISLRSGVGRGALDFMISLAFGWVPGATLLVAAGIALTTRRASVRELRQNIARRRRVPEKIAPFAVECEGRFTRETVRVSSAGPAESLNPAIQTLIEESWLKAKSDAEANGQMLYDGRVGRLVCSRVEGSVLHLDLGSTTYREFIGTNLYNAKLVSQMGSGLLADALGTSALIITADGRIVLGRRGELVSFHQGYLHTFGGLLDDCDQRDDGRYDVWSAIEREIQEELGIGRDNLSELACFGIVRDVEILQPEIFFEVHVDVASTELRRRFASSGDEEHTRLEACDDLPESIVPFIQRSDPVTPVAIAALLLHGKIHWGATWFENACYLLFGELPAYWSTTSQ